jgi:hypothetical protein
MSIRDPLRVEGPQPQQPHRRGQLDAAARPAAEGHVRPGVGFEPAARPEMNRQECVIFTVYVVLGVLIVLFLAATGVLWWLGG